ncbi:MAG TPA: MFS transporter [Bryobacteraceae bacterium]|nr:MFS transporter [Bryobacteraceae bacterium]
MLSDAPAAAQTARDRWLPCVSMLLVSLISYVDRSVLAVLAPVILSETHLNAEQYGVIISCFSIAYMFGNPVWGYILDRVGVRRGMTAAVSVWSVASMAHAWAGGFFSFSAARAVLGAAEGATFPGGLRTVTQTLPPKKRGRGLAIAYSGGSLGAMIAPLVVTPVAAEFGWHGAFIFTGVLGAAWLLFWRAAGRGIDTPEERETEKKLPPRVWAHPVLWGYMAAYALGAMPLGFILYDSSLYLHARFHWSQTTLGEVLWIPPFGWEVGYFFWGGLLDRFGPRFNGLMLASLVLSLPLAFLHSMPGAPLVLGEMFLAMFALAGYVVLSVAWATRAFPEGHSGFISGIGAGSWGAIVALTSPYLGHLFDLADYATAFRIATVFPVVGYFLWRAISSRIALPGPAARLL